MFDPHAAAIARLTERMIAVEKRLDERDKRDRNMSPRIGDRVLYSPPPPAPSDARYEATVVLVDGSLVDLEYTRDGELRKAVAVPLGPLEGTGYTGYYVLP